MIELRDVTKAVMAGGSRRPLFKHLDFWMEKGEHVAVLGIKGSGKSLLLELICGANPIDEGWIERTSTISWPIPISPFLSSTSSVATNLRFVARLYGIDQAKFIDEIAELGQIQPYLNYRLSDVPRFVKSQLSFSIAMWFDFDIYLFDEKIISTGPDFQARAKQVLESRINSSGMLLATSNPKIVLEYCSTAFVIDGGRAEHYTDIKAALKHFNSIKKDSVPESAEEEPPEDDDDEDDTTLF